MGYYSEVAIKCEEEAYKRFKGAFTEYFQPDEILKSGNLYVIHWNYVKWYEDFDEIEEIRKAMDELDDEGVDTRDGLGYSFMRIGEDLTDIETRLNDYALELWASRFIDLPQWEEIETEE